MQAKIVLLDMEHSVVQKQGSMIGSRTFFLIFHHCRDLFCFEKFRKDVGSFLKFKELQEMYKVLACFQSIHYLQILS